MAETPEEMTGILQRLQWPKVKESETTIAEDINPPVITAHVVDEDGQTRMWPVWGDWMADQKIGQRVRLRLEGDAYTVTAMDDTD